MWDVGDRLVESYTGDACVVESIHEDHMLVKYDTTGFQYMIHQKNYKFYKEVTQYESRENTGEGFMVGV